MSDIAQPTRDPADLLAYYDSRSVGDSKLMQIFSCSAEDLSAARDSADYKAFRAAYTDEIIEQSTAIDDGWNDLEQVALSNLRDTMDMTADPRMLLAIAREANKASRRNGSHAPNQGGADIDVPQNGDGKTRVVRLRARFVNVLEDPDGTRRIADREIDIRAGSSGDLNETLTPREVKGLLRDQIGVDTAEMHVKRHQGPDAIDGTYVDFDNLGEI